jgi:hypothetical protein
MAVLSTLFVLYGCSDDDTGVSPDGATAVALTISSGDVMTSAGDTRSVTAVVNGADQQVITAPSLTWRSNAPTVATVAGTGETATITAVGDGVATISATSGAAKGTVTVTVRRTLVSVQLVSPVPVVTLGSSVQLVATALDARQNVIPVTTGFTYTSSNPTGLMVSPTGLVTALFTFSAPTATITATLTKDGVTASGNTQIAAAVSLTFDYAGLMLSEYVKPTSVPTLGTGVGYFARDGAKLTYTITWSALSGPATVAHLHGSGDATQVAGTLVDFVPSAQSTNFGTVTGSFTAADIRGQGGRPPISLDSLITLLGTGHAYMDVHTAGFPDGEIRGQLFGPFR